MDAELKVNLDALRAVWSMRYAPTYDERMAYLAAEEACAVFAMAQTERERVRTFAAACDAIYAALHAIDAAQEGEES